MKWHTHSITKGCQNAARQLSDNPEIKHFYLAGGTALALIYGHRVSVDLDFFSNTNTLGFSERQNLLATLKPLRIYIEEEKDGTLHAKLGKTHLSFFRYHYRLLRPVRHWMSLRIAHPIDIALMKIGAIMGRGSQKDFYDLYTILQNEKASLPLLFRLALQKFDRVEDFKLNACRALVYFDDAENEPPPKLIKKVKWVHVKNFFEKEVRKLSSQYIL